MALRSLFHKFILSLLIFIGSNFAVSQSLPKKLHSHEITSDTARKYIANLKKDAMQPKINGGLFYRDVFDKLLSQKGVAALRFYFAKTDDGNPTLVAVGVDSTGKDLTKGVIAEAIYPCPPYCDLNSELVK